MDHASNGQLVSVAIFLLLSLVRVSQAHLSSENGIKTEVYLSPGFVLEPGSVSDKYYYDIDFPRGHIAIKSFNAEVVDEKGNSIPLHETYLHHWVLERIYYHKGFNIPSHYGFEGFHSPDHFVVKNDGVCDNSLHQYFGIGSETRRTETNVPDPYGIEVGNPEDIPDRYEEGWILNVHAIDTRGAEDKLGCTECRCDLYNVTIDEYGVAIPEGYGGGLKCCYDGARCRVKEGFWGVERKLYLRYTVKYVDWDASIVPVKIYILDATDISTKGRHLCQVEYDVETCPLGVANDGCVYKKTAKISFPTGGEVIYGVGHQHAGGTGTTLYGEGGRTICSSNPTYGKGNEPGNEAGYIVGMSTCYPSPGSVKISAGETLTLVSNYSSTQRHTGVMGLIYLLIADSSPNPNTMLQSVREAHRGMMIFNFSWALVLFGVAFVVVVIFALQGRSGRGDGYEAVV